MTNVVQLQTKTVVPTDEPELQPDLLQYSLYCPTWPARKLDKRVTQQAKDANDVKDEVEAGNFNKMCLPDCAELKALNAYQAATRQQFYLRTKSWGETRGNAVGLAEHHLDMLEWLRDRRDGLKPLVAAFKGVYQTSVQKAEFELQGMFNLADYPPWEVVESKFCIELSSDPLPNVQDIRVMRKVPDHVKEAIEKDILERREKSLQNTVREAVETLHKPLAHMAVTLKRYHDGDAKKLYESMVENVREMAASVRMTNITNNADLETLATEAEKLVAGLTTKDLKDSDGTQVIVGKKAQELANRIAALMP